VTLIIDNPTVEQVLTATEIIDALEEAHREQAQGRAINAPPYRVFTPRQRGDYGPHFPEGGDPIHHAFTSLTGAIAGLDIVCDRVDSDIITYVRRGDHLREVRVPGTPDRKFCGLLYLYSSRTGELLAIIHDGYLQKFRVAGTAAIGTKYLARQDARVMALIGTGWQAQAEVLCNAAVRRLARIQVYSPTPGHSQAFAERWSAEAGVEIVPVGSAREAVRGADFVITATNAPEPVVLSEWLEPGQFVTGVKDLELDLAGWERCDVLTTNRHGPMWQRYAIGGVEVIPEHGRDYWGQPSRVDWERLPLLGDVMLGQHPGRTSAEQITGLILRGDGIQFAAVGARIFQLCQARGLGTVIPSELFLQDERYIP
jgi:ornithine cyclodeaminase/alanine dehydrogenase-like protein (mu-crystallin family)